MNSIFLAGILLVAGSLGGAIASRCKCPRITGYLVVGILFSPSMFHFLSAEITEQMKPFTTLALGLIAYEIGASLQMDSLKASRKNLAWITALQALFPCILSTVLMAVLIPFLLDTTGSFRTTHLPLALLIGAMACPTAPAITVALVQECRARGPVTTLLLGVVGLTDAIAVVAYCVATVVCRSLVHGETGPFLSTLVLHPLLGILVPVAIGAVVGLVLSCFARFIRARALFLVTTVGCSLACTGVCELVGVSALLANLSLGFVVANREQEKGFNVVFEDVEDLIFTSFFVISGMLFDIHAISASGLVAVLIILGRCSGKYLGARLGAVIAGADDVMRKYFGLALLPKAGLVVGLAIDARTVFPELGVILFNWILASVIINTLLTPPLAKFAIRKMGECRI